MKQVLIVIPDHSYGGEERRSYDIYRHLNAESDISVLFTSSGTKFDFPETDFIRLPSLDRTYALIFSLYKLAKIIRKNRITHVLLFKRKTILIGYLLEKIYPNTSFIFNVANAWVDKKYMAHFYPSKIATLSTRLVENVSVRQTDVIPLGIDGQKFNYIGEEYQLYDTGVLRLISVGKVSNQKNHVRMIEIAHAIQTQLKVHVKIEIAGGGPLEEEFMLKSQQLMVDANILGYVSDVNSFLRKGGVYLQTSLYEGLPNALLEASHVGLPIVANSVGATADIGIDGGALWLVEDSTIDQYVNAFRELLSLNEKELSNRRKTSRLYIQERHNNEIMLSGYRHLICES